MPIYEYQCQKCGAHHEIMQKFSDDPLRACPACGGDLKKLISSTSFVLKGSGWYVTDYATGDRKKGMESEKPRDDTKASERKADTPVDTKPPEKKESTSPQVASE